jgi:uncharacterized protein (DUF1330 family)
VEIIRGITLQDAGISGMIFQQPRPHAPESSMDKQQSASNTAPAYAIGHITVRDTDKWLAYCSQVPATLAPWRGEVLLRAQLLDVFNGVHAHDNTVVLRFPDTAAVAGWHASPAYQALIPLRDAAADVTLIAFAG